MTCTSDPADKVAPPCPSMAIVAPPGPARRRLKPNCPAGRLSPAKRRWFTAKSALIRRLRPNTPPVAGMTTRPVARSIIMASIQSSLLAARTRRSLLPHNPTSILPAKAFWKTTLAVAWVAALLMASRWSLPSCDSSVPGERTDRRLEGKAGRPIAARRPAGKRATRRRHEKPAALARPHTRQPSLAPACGTARRHPARPQGDWPGQPTARPHPRQ